MAKKTRSRSLEECYNISMYHSQKSHEETIDYKPISNHPNSLKIRIDDLITLSPLTANQEKFFQYYNEGNIFIGLHGVAGSGKSLIALYKAFEEVLDTSNPYRKIVLIRSAVPSRDIGHLPGSIQEKIEVYSHPYIGICKMLFKHQDAYTRLIEQKYLQFLPTSFIRGMTFDDSIVIVDEMQNMTWYELSTIITRIGHNAKIIFIGDYMQTDLNGKHDRSGLYDFMKIALDMPSFRVIEFGIDDIVRSGLVKEWILAYSKHLNSFSQK